MLSSSHVSPCMHVWKHLVSQSLTQTPAHTRYGAADKHTHTHVSVHRPAHLCRTPPSPCFAVYCFGPFAVRLSYCWGLEFCSLGKRSEGERQMERRSEEKEEMEVLDGPQLVRAIVSMTCSSLLRSLCLLACSSRSNADKIWRRKGEEVSGCYNVQDFALKTWSHFPQTRLSEDTSIPPDRVIADSQC